MHRPIGWQLLAGVGCYLKKGVKSRPGVVQQQFQTREGTAEAYGMDSSALENLQVMDNVLEQIASRQKRDQPKLQLEVEDDDDAYEETYSTT